MIGSSLILSAILFTIGIVGVLVRKNAIVIFMAIEVMLNGANIAMIAFSKMHGIITGHIFVFFTITIAAAEAAVGLAIIVMLFRNFGTINVNEVNKLKERT